MASPCPLWGVLLRRFAIGKISASELQEIASAAVKSGANSEEMLGLQSLEHMMSHYAWLARNSLEHGLQLWSLVQKSHLILHLGDQG